MIQVNEAQSSLSTERHSPNMMEARGPSPKVPDWALKFVQTNQLKLSTAVPEVEVTEAGASENSNAESSM